MKYTLETFKSREEWLEARSIGGSSAASIVGLNPWSTSLELYNSLIGKRGKQKTGESLEYGQKMEPLIREIYRLNHPNWKVEDPIENSTYRSTEKPYLTATVDGTITDEEGRKGILEIKTHDVRKQEEYTNWVIGNIPKNYLIQVLHYLLVLDDYEFVEIVAKLRFLLFEEKVVEREEIIYKHIERKDVEETIKWLEAKETEFYEEHVLKRIPPQTEITF